MTKKTDSFVWRFFALASAFALTTTVALAAPYGFHFRNLPQWGGAPQSVDPQGNPYGVSNYYAPARFANPSYPVLTSPASQITRVAPPASDYVPSITAQGTYHWETQSMPIKVFISSGDGVPAYRPQFGQFIRNAFDEWTKDSEGKLAWREVSSPSEADITVKWTNQVTERPEGTEAGKTDALTRLNTVTGQGIIYGARMQFLTRMPNREFSDLEVAKTCMHEVGHAMGLQGHSPYRDDIMYYAVTPTAAPVLSQRDLNTLHRLYAGYPTIDAVALGAKPKPHQQ